MSIYSVVIHTKPEHLDSVSAELEKIKGVEVHGKSDKGKLVVSLDHPDRGYCSDTLMGFHNIPKVLNSSLIFEYFEEEQGDDDSAQDDSTRLPEGLKLNGDSCELEGACQSQNF